MQTTFILSAALAIRDAILTHESELESLDRAIGDGDHYINMKRGANTIVEIQAELATLTPDEALQKIGLKLLSTVGGASGPLLASFFMGMAKVVKENGDDSISKVAAAFTAGV
ncbi:MAG: DAK2 domain-containing protein, partial [Methylotenera sp.]